MRFPMRGGGGYLAGKWTGGGVGWCCGGGGDEGEVGGKGLDYLERFGGGVERTFSFGMKGIWIFGICFFRFPSGCTQVNRGGGVCFGKPRRAMYSSDLLGSLELTPDS